MRRRDSQKGKRDEFITRRQELILQVNVGTSILCESAAPSLARDSLCSGICCFAYGGQDDSEDALWKNPKCIDTYLVSNPELLSDIEREIIRNWNRFIADRFQIFAS